MKVEINDSKFLIEYDGVYYNIRDEKGRVILRTLNINDAVSCCDLIVRKGE